MAQKLTKTTQQRISRMVTAYHAFREAMTNQDDNGVVVWADMLRDAQYQLGVEYIADDKLDEYAQTYRRLRDQNLNQNAGE